MLRMQMVWLWSARSVLCDMRAGVEHGRCLLCRVRSEGSASSTCPLSLSSWGNSLPTGSTEKSCRKDAVANHIYLLVNQVSNCSTSGHLSITHPQEEVLTS